MIQPTPYLEMNGVKYRQGNFVLLDDISLAAASGKFVAVAGDDLTGKTSLLKLCAGLVEPAAGQVRLRGKSLAACSYRELQLFRQKTGFVFQEGALISNLTVKENITLPLRYHSDYNEAALNKSAEKYLELFNLVRYAGERPAELPLEIKLLAGLARALIVEPELLLLDEIFGSLNQNNRLTVINHLKEIKTKRPSAEGLIPSYGEPACLITTGLANLLSSFPERPLIDYLIVMESGRITEQGNPQTVLEKLLKNK